MEIRYPPPSVRSVARSDNLVPSGYNIITHQLNSYYGPRYYKLDQFIKEVLPCVVSVECSRVYFTHTHHLSVTKLYTCVLIRVQIQEEYRKYLTT